MRCAAAVPNLPNPYRYRSLCESPPRVQREASVGTTRTRSSALALTSGPDLPYPGTVQYFSHFEQMALASPTVVAIGNFDGVHLGHQALLRRVLSLAEQHEAQAAVLTFNPHPAQFFQPQNEFAYLSPSMEKRALLAHFGIDVLLAQAFDSTFAQRSPAAFVDAILVDALKARCVVVGYDFRFGQGRLGDVTTLTEMGLERGFETHVIEPQTDRAGVPMSSSTIRDWLAQGDLQRANAALGRPFHIAGWSIQGDQRGRRMGFPTVNLAWTGVLNVPGGVYAGWLDVGEGARPAVINVGQQPTFGMKRAVRIEAHVIDGPINVGYGHPIRIWFEDKVRPERAFANVDALVEQIARDIGQARRLLRTGEPPPELLWFSNSAS
ncbi:MAG: bifunctional riboflavin kinase/FAD synthetase [Myxococcota bacterium]|nr:bifunctional riboflavin kinase/FAD synthetase [Myxococcota bacterium]